MNRKSFVYLSLLVFLLTGTVLTSTGSSESAQSGDLFQEVEVQSPSGVHIDPELGDKFQQGFSIQDTGTVEVVVALDRYREDTHGVEDMKDQASKSQASLLKFAENSPKVEVVEEFWITNAVLLEVERGFPIENIARVEGTTSLMHNSEVSTLQGVEGSGLRPQSHGDSTYGLEQINATEVWEGFGTGGEGVKVAVLDTGIEPDHPDLDLYTENESDSTYPGGWAEFDYGEVDESEPYDCGSHGTHVSGTVAGKDASGGSIGVAPNASLMHAGVLMQGSDCTGQNTDIIGGIEWAVENDADIVSMSLGVYDYEDSFIDAVRNAEQNGTLVVGASGNYNESSSVSPSNVYDAFAVGASDSSYSIPNFSSGEKVEDSDWDNPPGDWPEEYIVPDVAAPGVNVYSSEPGDDYGFKSGTSMAAPHVSGAAALVQSATYERLGPNQLKEAFLETAWKPSDWNEDDAEAAIDGKDTRYGKGIIDVYGAVEYALENFESPEFQIQDLELDSTEVVEGQKANLTGLVNNTGGAGKADLRFLVNGTETGQQDIELGFGENKTFYFEEQFDEPGFYELYVNSTGPVGLDVLEEPELVFNGFNLSESEIFENESIEAYVEVQNVGEASGEFDVNLSVDDEIVQNSTVELSPGEINVTEFERSFNEWGSYTLSSGPKFGVLDVLKPGSVEIVNSSISAEEIAQNESVELKVETENPGNVSASSLLSFEVDGSTEDEKNVSLENNTQEDFYFYKEFEEKGVYQLSVNGSEPHAVEVLAPAELNQTGLSLSSKELVEGEEIQINSSVENTGGIMAEFEVDLIIDLGEQNIVNRSREVELGSGEEKNVTFEEIISEPGEHTANSLNMSENFTVLEDADLQVLEASTNTSEIFTGQSIEVEALINNTGQVPGSDVFNFTAGEATELKESDELGPGENSSIFQTLVMENEGNFTAEVNGTEAGGVEVKKPFVNITSVSGKVSDTGLIEIQASVNNTDPGSIKENLVLSVNGSSVKHQNFELGSEENKTVSMQYDWNQTGLHNYSLNSTELGDFDLDPHVTFSGLEPESESFEEGEDIDFSGSVDVVGDGTLTANVDGEEVFGTVLEPGQNSFEFTESFSTGELDWRAIAEIEGSTFESSLMFFDVESSSFTSSGGGDVPAGLFDDDPELETRVEEDSAEASNIYASEGETVELDFSGGPRIDFVEINATEELENASFSIEPTTRSTNHSLESIYNVQTNAEASFRLEFTASREWLEDHSFEPDEVSLHNLDSGQDLEASNIEESEEEYRYEAFTDSFSALGIGVDRACQSMENINASDGESCEAFDNICRVPDGWEEVSTCEDSGGSDVESSVLERFEILKEESPENEDLREANQSIQEGDFEQAAKILDRMEEDQGLGLGPEHFVVGILLTGVAAVIILLVYRGYSRRELIKNLDNLSEAVSELPRTEQNIRAAEKVAEADQAALEGDYQKARKLTFQAKKMIE